MALKGTLKDFGIADILQLIGQQQKTGLLNLRQKQETVVVAFKDGSIVRAESGTRSRKELIGAMLVRAGVISEAQLEAALEGQKRTLQRLGDVLVSQNALTEDKFKEMVHLQTEETLFKLFAWKTGSYAFDQGEVLDADSTVTPLRAESVLMEGFRRVDEWPAIRKRITSHLMTFQRLKDLPAGSASDVDFETALDDAFAEKTGERKRAVDRSEFRSLGDNERRVFALVAKSRTFQQIADLSCLGEFETGKALCNLVNLEYLQAFTPAKKSADDFDSGGAASLVAGVAARTALVAGVLASIYLVATQVDFAALRLGLSSASSYSDPAIKRFASRQQLSRIAAALQVYKLEKRTLPLTLRELADADLLSGDDLRYPWVDEYHYRRVDPTSYVLLPPLR
jgi:hypothetical protein